MNKHHNPKYSNLSPLSGCRFLKIGEIVKNGDFYYRHGAGPWIEIIAPDSDIGHVIESWHAPICRKIEYVKHHDPEHSDLAPLDGYRFVKIGEKIKDGDYGYYGGKGPWTPAKDFNSGVIGHTLSAWNIPFCRKIANEPIKPKLELILEQVCNLKGPNGERFSIPDSHIAFRISTQNGFDAKEYVASNGISIQSSGSPHFSGNKLWLRGVVKSEDNTIMVIFIEDYNKICAAVKEILERENKLTIIKRAVFQYCGEMKELDVIFEDNDSIKGYLVGKDSFHSLDKSYIDSKIYTVVPEKT